MKPLLAVPPWTSHIVVAAVLASVCTLSGCVSRPPLHKQTFTFTAPAIDPTNAVASERVLGVRRLQIAPPFDGRSLVYRTGEVSYVRDPYAEFLDPPAEDAPRIAGIRGPRGGHDGLRFAVAQCAEWIFIHISGPRDHQTCAL